jgi:hypothetical protein
MIPRTPVKKARKKPRPGRLKGADLFELRRECYMRDHGFCRECGVFTYFTGPEPINDHSYHMAHIQAKRMGGDSPFGTRLRAELSKALPT